MSSLDRSLWRAATKIAEALQTHQHQPPLVVLPHGSFADAQQLLERWKEVRERGWLCAAEHLRDDLEFRLRCISRDLDTASSRLDAADQPTAMPRSGDVYHELTALKEEFDGVDIDLRGTELTVCTDRIVLEDLDLGPFEIVWNWSSSRSDRALQVIAQEPNCPSSRDDVSHPHVLDGTLCEGDAQQPLRRALQAGRLCDYFLIVRQVLQTYNPSSAYVRLDDWYGVHCSYCDGSFDQDDLYHCNECSTRVCSDCGEQCAECGADGCRSCLYLCTKCDQMFCPQCWPRRSDGPVFICRGCDDQAKDKETADETQPLPAPPPPPECVATDAPVHADGVGQAAVPARPGRHRNRRVRTGRRRQPAARG